MWSKIRSLSFKLTIFYIVSLLVITLGIIVYVEYQNYQNESDDAMRDAEVGLGYLNGAVPQAADYRALDSTEYVLTGDDIDNRLERFKSFFDTTVPGGVSVVPSLDGPVTIDNKDYYSITYQVTNIASNYHYDVGPIMLPESNFPATIALQMRRWSQLYYLPVAGHDDMVWVVSLNSYTYPPGNLEKQIRDDVTMALPIIIVFAVGFGLLISWITTKPLKRITRATELLSHSDLDQRVQIKSGDEIGRLGRSFNTMADRLEESFNTQRRFVSDAAHELRTPLASMKTSVTRALGADRNTAEYQKLLDFLSGRIGHMEGMVNDLLFLSRVDEGKLTLEETRLDISELLGESEESFRYLFEDKGVAFSTEIEPGLYVKGDRKLMLRVISNLLDNAAKKTPADGHVSLKAKCQDNSVVITVSDTGPGIPPEHLPHIFDRFYKVPGFGGDDNGYGLGLAISKSIVSAVGGNISVRSEAGKGTVFTIELPRLECSTTA